MPGKPEEREIPEETFLRKKLEIENQYKLTEPTNCPYLKNRVNFNASGLEHLKFKDTKERPRNKYEQYIRFKLFYLVPEILRKSHTLQGYWETKEWERQKRHGVWEKILIDIKYYEFIAVIGKARIKVIIKKIEKEGSYIFWSVIPFWKMNKETSKRILHDEII